MTLHLCNLAVSFLSAVRVTPESKHATEHLRGMIFKCVTKLQT